MAFLFRYYYALNFDTVWFNHFKVTYKGIHFRASRTYQLPGMASTLRMRTTISPRQWQPWTGVSSFLGLIISTTEPQARGLSWDHRSQVVACVQRSWHLEECFCTRLGSKQRSR